MPLSNTETRYGGIAKTFHWAVMLLIFTLIPLGIYANRLAHLAEEDPAVYGAQAAYWFSLHKTIGIALLGVAILRILWALTQPKPVSLHPDRRVETFLAETVHFTLYAALILVPLAGWISHAASTGFAPIWWPLSQDLPFVPKSEAVKDIAGSVHIVFERVLVGALLLHIAGALKHHYIDKDATLRRMWFGRPELSQIPSIASGGAIAPAIGALVIYGAALGIGANMGLYSVEASATASVTEEAPRSTGGNWQVTDGTLAIEVTQFGSPVEGAFDAWSADIDFDEATGTGTVEVRINIPSLSLGSITQQAMGADYFAAEEHPSATFTADIVPAEVEGRFTAGGTLTLKGVEVPVTLPFTLDISGDTATMEGTITLDRRDFGIGGGDPDPGFDVPVTVNLTATRATAS